MSPPNRPTDSDMQAALNKELLMMLGMGRVDQVKNLITEGADPHFKTDDNSTLLHRAAMSGHTGLIDWLVVEQELDVNATNDAGITPVMMAAMSGFAPAIATLAAHTADLNMQDIRGRTALYLAAEAQEPQCIAELIGNGAKVNIPTHSKWLPIHKTAEADDVESAYMLARAGADLTARNSENKTAPEIAEFMGLTATLQVMREAAAERNTQRLKQAHLRKRRANPSP